MNKIAEKIFRFYKPNFAKLKEYGFVNNGGTHEYTADIMDGQFSVCVKVSGGDISTEVVDSATGEEYTLFLIDGAGGSFVGEVRTAYENLLTDIAGKCFDRQIFKSEYAQKLIEYVFDTYGDEPEYLWDKFPDCAIWRRKDNNKWYGLLLTATKDKIGLNSNEKIEIIDLKADTNSIDSIVDGNTVFRGYHMNKKHWITLCLDGSVKIEDIEKMLDDSYVLAGKK